MKIIEFLQSNSIEELTARFAIKVKQHPKYPNLHHFSYDQIDSPKTEDIVQEARALILDKSQNWRPIAKGYRRFFNHGEGTAAPIDWKNADVLEKLDGSYICMFHYDGEWQVCTKGTPDAGGCVNNTETVFRDHFWKVWKKLGYKKPGCDWNCFVFELCTKENRVIIPHDKERIVLIGARDMITLKELDPQPFAELYGWELVKTYPIRTVEECIEASRALNPMQNEGFVVRNRVLSEEGDFNRLKIKSPDYEAISHLKDGFGRRRMLNLARTDNGTEWLEHFPELKAEFEEIQGKYQAVVDGAQKEWERLKDIPVQKDFALEVQKTPYAPILFSLRLKKAATVKEFLANCTENAIERLVDISL